MFGIDEVSFPGGAVFDALILLATHAAAIVGGFIFARWSLRQHIDKVAHAAEVAFRDFNDAEQESRAWEHKAHQFEQEAKKWLNRWMTLEQERLNQMEQETAKRRAANQPEQPRAVCVACETGQPCAAAAACNEGWDDDETMDPCEE